MPLPGTNTGSAPGFLTTTARLCAGTKIADRQTGRLPVIRGHEHTVCARCIAGTVHLCLAEHGISGSGIEDDPHLDPVIPHGIRVKRQKAGFCRRNRREPVELPGETPDCFIGTVS